MEQLDQALADWTTRSDKNEEEMERIQSMVSKSAREMEIIQSTVSKSAREVRSTSEALRGIRQIFERIPTRRRWV